jgi:hypothetical protein
MVGTLPVPIEFSLPESWRSVRPDDVGSGEAAFVALHPPSVDGFTANITVSGEVRPATVPLTQVADEALAQLRIGARELHVGNRTTTGSPTSPGLTQAVRMSVELHGRVRDIAQLQVYVGMRDVRDGRRQAVLHVSLTATPDQFAQVVDSFLQFISTIRPSQERS